MHLRSPSALLALSLSCATVPPAAGPSLSGTWAPVSAELGGKDFPVSAFAGAALRLDGDAYDFGGDQGSYQLIGGMPQRMDIIGRQGPNAGRVIPAIYALDGDRLTVCYQLGAGARPAEFTSPVGTKVLLVRYQRRP